MNETELTQSNFDNYIKESTVPVLVDFYADWCAPCMRMKPVLALFAKDYGDEFRIGTVNIDSEIELAERYNIQSIPTLLVFKDGKIISKGIGAKNRRELLQLINKGE